MEKSVCVKHSDNWEEKVKKMGWERKMFASKEYESP